MSRRREFAPPLRCYEDTAPLLYIKVCRHFRAVFRIFLTFLRKKMPKCLHVRKKSLPLHPHLRKTASSTRGAALRGEGRKSRSSNGKCKVLEKIFAGLKKIVYLCSPFASQNAEFFQRFFELLFIFERKNLVFICQFPLRK